MYQQIQKVYKKACAQVAVEPPQASRQSRAEIREFWIFRSSSLKGELMTFNLAVASDPS